MSQPPEIASASPELPRLRIHHLLILTTIFSLVMATYLGLMRLFQIYSPNAVMQELDNGISVLLITQWLPLSIFISIALFGLAWRKQGISFPSQPGHWLALFFTFNFLLTLLLSFSMLLQQTDYDFALLSWVSLIASLLFHCFLVIFWGLAFLCELDPIWRWGWATMALRSLFSILMAGLHVILRCVEWLIETFWHRHYPLEQWLTLPLGPSTGMWMMIFTNYACIAFFIAAIFSDTRHNRRRHWSHWLVLVSELFAAVSLSFYYHWALNEYF
jgi:hypothetical protein